MYWSFVRGTTKTNGTVYEMSTVRGKKTVIASDQQVWLRPEPGMRRPKHTREMIAAAALRIADSEGIDAVSMRRVAAELDAGTMTLYHYVSTKAELLALLFDAVIGELLVREALPDDWRRAMQMIALRTRDSLMGHPWTLDIVGHTGGLGPNAVRHFEQSLQAVSSFDGTFADKINIIALVDEYTFGYCKRCSGLEQELQDQGAVDEEFTYLRSLIDAGDFPQLEGLLQLGDMATMWNRSMEAMKDPGRFERNLDRLLGSFARQ